jgi:hypothetical protein
MESMIETTTTILVAAGSLLLLAYWFRYTCMLLLSTKTTRDYASEVAAMNQLSFLEVQERLRATGPVELDALSAALDRDFALLRHLLEHAGASDDTLSLEDRLLAVNYRLAQWRYKTLGRVSVASARAALDEMAVVVSHFANTMGERAAAQA